MNIWVVEGKRIFKTLSKRETRFQSSSFAGQDGFDAICNRSRVTSKEVNGLFQSPHFVFLSMNILHLHRAKNNLLTSNMISDFSEDTQPTTKIIECKIWAVDCRKGWRRMVTPKGVCDILASHTLKHEMANNTFRKFYKNLIDYC